jgi:hypothetical protein
VSTPGQAAQPQAVGLKKKGICIMVNLLYLFIALISLKILLNTWKYFSCQYYLSQYMKYIGNKSNWKIVEHSLNIKGLFNSAGISDSFLPHAEPVGDMHMTSYSVSVIDNITTVNPRIVDIILQMFHQAIGVYRTRIFESINPFYWVEVIITLPKVLFHYLGVPPEKIIVKIFQVIYWVLGAIIAFTLAVFPSDIYLLIKSIVK